MTPILMHGGMGSEGSLAKDQTFSGFSFVHPSLSFILNCETSVTLITTDLLLNVVNHSDLNRFHELSLLFNGACIVQKQLLWFPSTAQYNQAESLRICGLKKGI